jgi:predicted nucleic-acid-binding protein
VIAIDTNILVRYFTQDDPEQAKVVDGLLLKHSGKARSIFINNIVICELIWTLKKGYKYSKGQLLATLKFIIKTKEFAFEQDTILRLAVEDYETENFAFSDSLIALLNRHYGCEMTLSLDELAINKGIFERLTA